MVEESDSEPPRHPQRVRRRWTTLLFLLVLGLFLGVVLLAHSLDRPWLKIPLQSLLRKMGLDIDWNSTRLGLYQIRVEGLVVLSPEPIRTEERELARIDRLEVNYTPRSLLFERRFQSVEIGRLDLHVAEDAAGNTSFSLFSNTPLSTSQPSATPTSQLVGSFFAGLRPKPPIERLEIDTLNATYVKSVNGISNDRYSIANLSFTAQLAEGPDGARLSMSFGTQSQPLRLELERQVGTQAREAARLGAWALLTMSSRNLDLRADLRLFKLEHHSPLPFHRLLQLALAAEFKPKAGQIEVKVQQAEAADGALSVGAEVSVSDTGSIQIRQAHGTVMASQLLRLVPRSLLSLAVENGRLTFALEKLHLDPGPRLDSGGSVRVATEWSSAHASGLSIGDGELHLDVQAHKDASLQLSGRAHASSVAAYGGRQSPRTQVLGIALAIDGILAKAEVPKVPRDGLVRLTADFLKLDIGTAHGSVVAERGQLKGSAQFARGRLDDIDLELPVANLRLPSRRGASEGAARLEAHLSALHFNSNAPWRSTGDATVTATFAEDKVALGLQKGGGTLGFDLHIAAPKLAFLRSLILKDALGSLQLDRGGVRLKSVGQLGNLSALGHHGGLSEVTLEHRTEIESDHFKFGHGVRRFAANRLLLRFSSSGTIRRHQGQVSVRVGRLALGSVKGDVSAVEDKDVHGGGTHRQLILDFGLDLDTPALRLRLSTPVDNRSNALIANFGFDRQRQAVTYEVDGKLRELDPLASLTRAFGGLSDVDLEPLKVTLRGRGALFGLVRDGLLRFPPWPPPEFAIIGNLEFDVAHLNWSHGDRQLEVPKIHWRADFGFDGVHRTVKSHLNADTVSWAIGLHESELKGFMDDLQVTLGPSWLDGEGAIKDVIEVAALRQDYLPGYPVEGLRSHLEATRDKDGVFRVSTLRIENRGAGTTLSLKGGLDLGTARRSLSIRGELKQDVARLWSLPGEFNGRGEAILSLQVATGDFRVFHTLGTLRASHADVKLPQAGVSLESIDGEIPLAVDLVLTRKGLRFLRNTTANTYSELRFADQHPLLHQPSYLLISRVVTPLTTVAPLAGNLRIEQNVLSLNQLELGLRGGRVTGQCIIDWKDQDTTVQLHVRASRVEASHREPFDGNLAAVVSLRQRSVEGRAEILRIGRRHLLDLLDFQDPHHGDAAMNRVRHALAFGYPDKVRLAFNHGFAAIRITLGGLARLIRISELRGIPVGPIIDRLIAPFQKEDVP
jgi:translocation and assembly module TamB